MPKKKSNAEKKVECRKKVIYRKKSQMPKKEPKTSSWTQVSDITEPV